MYFTPIEEQWQVFKKNLQILECKKTSAFYPKAEPKAWQFIPKGSLSFPLHPELQTKDSP